MSSISNDPWHFPRTELAKQILGMFETGLARCLVPAFDGSDQS